MHNLLKKELCKAKGVSEFIIGVNLDIRGFSAFSKKVESPEAAVFLKKVYTKLIDNYFSEASFIKPTGDGLLIIIPYTEEELSEVAKRTMKFCLNVVRDFGSFCTNDPMINFEVPTKVGIGLSRGTACRLFSGKVTLDYSGRVLNLASRLMDLARPSGIVFDADFGITLLEDEQRKLFEKDSVYIKGIAERQPIEIYYTKNLTTIPALNKQALDKIKWGEITFNYTLEKIRDLGPTFFVDFPEEPIDPKEIKVQISHSATKQEKKMRGFAMIFGFTNFEYLVEAGKSKIRMQFDALATRLEANKVKNHWIVAIKVVYPKR
jgi:class 3 adenylate cyclase